MFLKNSKKFLKLSLILSLLLAIVLISMPALAAGDDISINVTVSVEGVLQQSKDNQLLMQLPMQLAADTDIITAIQMVHQNYHAQGADAYQVSGISFSKFWNIETYNVGYLINGQMIMESTTTLKDGDDLELTIYKDFSSDLYTRFEKQAYSIDADQSLALKVLYNDILSIMSEQTASIPLADATILISNSANTMPTASTFTTNSEGIASLNFDSAGTYYLSVAKAGQVLVPAIAQVKVTAALDDSGKQAIINDDLAALSFDDLKGQNSQPTAITANLDLPAQGESTKTAISWQSDNQNIISNDGLVYRPSSTATDQQVTLTATISYGNLSATKDFVLTVSKNSQSDQQILDAAISQLATTYTAQEWANDQYLDTNIISVFNKLAKAENHAITVDNIVGSDNQATIAADGAISYGSSEEAVIVTFSLNYGLATANHSLTVTVPAKTASKADAFAAAWLNEAWLMANPNGNIADLDQVKLNFYVPDEDPEEYYTELSWASSDEDILIIGDYPENNGYLVTVTRPEFGQTDAIVELTATIAGGMYWDFGVYPPGPMPEQNGTKSFTLTIPAVTEAEQAAAQTMLDEAIKLYSLDNTTIRGSKLKADLSNLTYHINGIPLNWNYVEDLADFKEEYRSIKVTWTTDNPGFSGNAGSQISSGAEVNRIASDQSGDIILTLSYNGAEAQKKWPTTIKAWDSAAASAEMAILQSLAAALDYEDIRGNNASDGITEDLNLVRSGLITDTGLQFMGGIKYTESGANISWSSSNTAIIDNDLDLVAQPAFDTKVVLTASLESIRFESMSDITTLTKQITVNVKGSNGALNTAHMLANTAQILADLAKANSDFNAIWALIDIMAYEKLANQPQIFTAAEEQLMLNNMIDAAAAATSAADISKAILAISALGYDATDISLPDGNKLNLVQKLTTLIDNDDSSVQSIYTLPYILLALQQDAKYATASQIEKLLSWAMAAKDSWQNTEYGPDTMASMVLALAPYYGSSNAYNGLMIKDAIDQSLILIKEIHNLPDSQNGDLNKGFGAAASTGLGIAALAALGIDSADYLNNAENSLLDGLIYHYDVDTHKFKPIDNYFSTEQCFRGLLAAYAIDSNANQNIDLDKAVSIWDFADIVKKPAKSTKASPNLEAMAATLLAYIEADDQNLAWLVADMAAFNQAYPQQTAWSPEQKNAALNLLINQAKQALIDAENPPNEYYNAASKFSQLIIAISALGYDAADIVTADGSQINLVSQLNALIAADDSGVSNIYVLPYIIIALQQDSSYAAAEQIAKLKDLALSSKAAWQDTAWGSDTVAAMILALAPYYQEPAIKTVIDEGLELIKAIQKSDGALYADGSQEYGATSTGLGIAAVAALGIDPASISKDNNSLVDGLMSYHDSTTASFKPTFSSFATEQGFRGLLAAALITEGSSDINAANAYYLYDFAALDKAPALAVQNDKAPLIFELDPASATVIVKDNNNQSQTATVGKLFYLDAGSYSYQVSLDGYRSKSGSFTISEEQVSQSSLQTINVSLSKNAASGGDNIDVSFTLLGIDDIVEGKDYIYQSHPQNFDTWISRKNYSFNEGISVFELFDQALSDAKINYVASGGYVTEINGLAEFSTTPTSGWMYLLNGEHITRSLRDQILKDGDNIIMHYTDDYTLEQGAEDFGGGAANNNQNNAANQQIADLDTKASIENGQVQAQVKAEDLQNTIANALAQAEPNQGITIAINVESPNQEQAMPTNLQLSFDLSSALQADLQNEQIAALAINSDLANIEFDKQALAAIIEQGKELSGDIQIKMALQDNSLLSAANQALVGDNPVYDFSLFKGEDYIGDLGQGKVKISLPYQLAANQTAADIVVWYIDENGHAQPMITEYQDGILTFYSNHFSLYMIGATDSYQPFNDISSADWFYEAVIYNYQNQLFKGLTETEFAPYVNLNRAMFITILYRLEGEPAISGSQIFSDVAADSWYDDAINWAQANGIAQGITADLFAPEALISREQIATMLYNYSNYKTYSSETKADLSSYSDYQQISDWALDALAWANGSGLINGRNADLLAPLDLANRAEAAMIMMRFIETFVK